MDLEIEGRHALFFDDDATAAFVNSRDALVPCNYDASLLIDRYDVRHLLDRNPPRPTAGTRRQRLLDDACDAVSLAEIDCERYKDLPPDEEGDDRDSECNRRESLDFAPIRPLAKDPGTFWCLTIPQQAKPSCYPYYLGSLFMEPY